MYGTMLRPRVVGFQNLHSSPEPRWNITFWMSFAAFFWLRFEFSMIRVISSFCIFA